MDNLKIMMFLNQLMANNTKLSIEVAGLRKELREDIRKAVEAALGEKVAMIEGALKEVIMQKKVLFDKGLITREELNSKYAESGR